MSRQPDPLKEELVANLERDVTRDYRRLLATLASRAKWLGSRDPECAAQEALKRSIENPNSQSAVDYYFSQDPPPGLEAPEWPLDQLYAWLHGVLFYVVQEEHHRTSSQREVPVSQIGSGGSDEHSRPDPADPAPNQLDTLIQKELHGIVVECFPRLHSEHQKVLTLRAEGLKYGEIARRMGVNENTVATWISRGIRALARCVRRRSGGLDRRARPLPPKARRPQ